MEPISALGLSAIPGFINLIGNQLGKNRYKKDPFYKEMAKNYKHFSAQAKMPFTQTTGFLAPLAQIRENQREASRIAANNMAGGGTAESQIALQGDVNKNTSRSISSLLSMGPQYQNMMYSNAFQSLGAMSDIKSGYDQRRMGGSNAAASNVASGVGSYLSGQLYS